MPQIDPVVLRLEADLADYNRIVAQAERLTDQRLRGIETSANRMGAGVTKAFNAMKVAALAFVSAHGIAAIKNLITTGLEYAASLGEIAAQAGVTTTALQEYYYAGTQVNLSQAEVVQGLEQLNRRLGDAALGTGTAGRALARLGIDLRNANGEVKNAADIIPEIAEAMQGVSTEAEKAALRQELFGRSGQKMAALLAGGAAGVNQLRDAAHGLGRVLSEKQIADADEAADKLEKVKTVLSTNIASVVANNANAILDLADAMEELINAAFRAIPQMQKFWHQANAIDSEIKARTYSISPWPHMRAQASGFREDATASWARVAQLDRQMNPGPLARALAMVPRARAGGAAGGAYNYDPDAGGGSGRTRTGSGGGRARIGPSAEELARAIRDATLEAQRLAADLDMAYAGLIADAGERAEAQAAAQKARIDADLAADLARVQDTKNISDELRAQHAALHEQTAAVRKQIVEHELAAELERQANEERQRAERRRATLAGLELDALDAEATFADTARKRRDLEKKLLAHQQAEDKARLEIEIAAWDLADQTAARADLARAHAAERQGLKRDHQGPGAAYLERLKDDAEDLDRAYERAAVNGLERIEDALTRATKNALGLHGVLGDIIGDLIRIGIQRQIIGPLANAIFGPEGGGGGLFASIGKLFGGGRASGGFVNAGQAYRVNEGASPGRVEGFMPLGSGKIIPLGQMNTMAQQPSQSGGGVVRLVIEEAPGFAARVRAEAVGVTVEYDRQTAESRMRQTAAYTLSQASRPTI